MLYQSPAAIATVCFSSLSATYKSWPIVSINYTISTTISGIIAVVSKPRVQGFREGISQFLYMTEVKYYYDILGKSTLCAWSLFMVSSITWLWYLECHFKLFYWSSHLWPCHHPALESSWVISGINRTSITFDNLVFLLMILVQIDDNIWRDFSKQTGIYVVKSDHPGRQLTKDFNI